MNWVRHNPGLIFIGAFGGVGVVLLAVAGWSAVGSWNYLQNAKRTTGVVTEIISSASDEGGQMYKPRVEYQANGPREYVPSGSSSNLGYKVGQKVEVMYDPKDPDKAKLNSFFDLWFVTLVCGLMGLVFGSIGAGFLVSTVHRKKLDAWLLKHGRKIEAEFTGTGAGKIVVNGNTGWTVLAQWQNPADKKIYVFESGTVWADPESFVKDKKVSVLIDPRKPKRYKIDMSFMPEIA